MNQFELKQSGKKDTFSTGAQRDSQDGKPEQWMGSPLANVRYGHLLAKGAKHYGLFNYQKGFPLSRTLASLHRHLDQYLAELLGFPIDPILDEDGEPIIEDHLAAIRFGADVLMHTEEAVARGLLPKELLDIKPPHELKLAESHPDNAPIPVPREEPPPVPPTDREKQLTYQGMRVGQQMADALRRLEGREKLERGEPVLFYVAGPFTGDGSLHAKQSNQMKAEQVGKHIKALGHYVHVPHAATGYLDTEEGGDQDLWNYCMTMDLMLIERACDALFIIKSSPGADLEAKFAIEIGLPVFNDLKEIPMVTKVTYHDRLGINTTEDTPKSSQPDPCSNNS